MMCAAFTREDTTDVQLGSLTDLDATSFVLHPFGPEGVRNAPHSVSDLAQPALAQEPLFSCALHDASRLVPVTGILTVNPDLTPTVEHGWSPSPEKLSGTGPGPAKQMVGENSELERGRNTRRCPDTHGAQGSACAASCGVESLVRQILDGTRVAAVER